MLPFSVSGREISPVWFVLDCTSLVTRVGSLSIILLTLLSLNLVSAYVHFFGTLYCCLHLHPHCTLFLISLVLGGWVGLSEITNIGNGDFLVIERDNRAGPDAAIKRIYKISLGTNLDVIVDGSNVTKSLYRNILPDVSTAIGGLALEKVEGMALLKGNLWFNTDNDGTDGTSGESRLINLGKLVR